MDWTCAQRKSRCQLSGSINGSSKLMGKAMVLQLVANFLSRLCNAGKLLKQ